MRAAKESLLFIPWKIFFRLGLSPILYKLMELAMMTLYMESCLKAAPKMVSPFHSAWEKLEDASNSPTQKWVSGEESPLPLEDLIYFIKRQPETSEVC
jgi:hypothetical protein